MTSILPQPRRTPISSVLIRTRSPARTAEFSTLVKFDERSYDDRETRGTTTDAREGSIR